MRNQTLFHLAAAVALCTVVACGGRAQNAATNALASPASAIRESGAAMMTTATVPPTLHCGAEQPVWVNMRTKAYHRAGDPYYGRSKHGEYLCPAQAQAQGFHPAGMHQHGMRGMAAPTASPE